MDVYVLYDKKIVVFWILKCVCIVVVLWFYYNVFGYKYVKQDFRILLYKNKYFIFFEDGKYLVENEKYIVIGFVCDLIIRSVLVFLSKFLYCFCG